MNTPSLVVLPRPRPRARPWDKPPLSNSMPACLYTPADTGTIIRLNQKLRPGCYAARSDPKDVARSMGDTFICSREKKDAGPTNNWLDPTEMRSHLETSFTRSMEGRRM